MRAASVNCALDALALSPAADNADKEQQDDRTNRRTDDLPNDSRELKKARQQEPSNDRTGKSDDDIPEKSKARALEYSPGKPAGGRSYQKHHNNANGIHVYPPL
jgi:hypothetical protein